MLTHMSQQWNILMPSYNCVLERLTTETLSKLFIRSPLFRFQLSRNGRLDFNIVVHLLSNENMILDDRRNSILLKGLCMTKLSAKGASHLLNADQPILCAQSLL